ncbi:hypothetical protein V6Z12_A02G074100 [Gossypium hirsutum]
MPLSKNPSFFPFLKQTSFIDPTLSSFFDHGIGLEINRDL